MRLESLLADVWTRDILPFPGMISRTRGEHNVRSSASSIMRKLSVASIASNFSKRSNSIISIHRMNDDDLVVDVDAQKLREAYSPLDLEDLDRTRLPVIADAKENQHKGSMESIAVTLSRVAMLSGRPVWAPDGGRIITPPLRTSSANGVAHYRASSMSTVKTDGDVPTDEEVGWREKRGGKWGRGKVGRSLVAA